MVSADDRTTPGEVLSRIARFGKVHYFETLASTNDYALSLAGAHEPAVVIARGQTGGRGRFRRDWFSDDGSLCASLLLFTDAPGFRPVPFLTHMAGLALCLAVEETCAIAPRIRWPNDVVFKDRKLAGVLCESRRNAAVVGVGLNVNQASMPEELPEAGSLRMATEKEWDKLALLESFLAHLTGGLAEAAKGDTTALMQQVKDRSLVMHRRVEVKTMFRKWVGTVVDLDAEGRVVLRTDSGRLAVIGAGQARRLR
jgi:BirA family biotin operon repressor/biotin-[acetyl-CoA-carboxylase] ligase